MLGAFKYKLVYLPGRSILSRLPLVIPEKSIPADTDVLMLECSPEAIMTAKEVAEMTIKDPILSQVLTFALNGWPDKLFEEFSFEHIMVVFYGQTV